MITITLQFETQDAAVAYLSRQAAPAASPAPAEVAPPKPAKAAKPAPTPTVSETATATPAPEPVQPEPAAASPSKGITLEEVRAKLAALSQAGKAPGVKALIAGAGFTKLTDIPADQYANLLEKAAAL